MPRGTKIQLSFAEWPTGDQAKWAAAFESGDLFDGRGPGAHLAAPTRKSRHDSYARFLGFLSVKHADLLELTPEARITPEIIAEYVAWRGASCSQTSMAIDLDHLHGARKLLSPKTDWSWLRKINRRFAAVAIPKTPRFHLDPATIYIRWEST
jgi:hypothetical protein